MIERKEKTKINVKTAVELLRESWDEISEKTIRHCWGHTKIFEPKKNARLIKDEEEKEFDRIVLELKELLEESGASSVSATDATNVILVDSQEPIEEEPSALDLVKQALGPSPNDPEEEEEETEDKAMVSVTGREALTAFELISQFVTQEIQNETEQEEMWMIMKRLKQNITNKIIRNHKKQNKITDFFSSSSS
jgi:hypothetical protein